HRHGSLAVPRTMPQWPREYTVRAWRPDLERDFCHLVVLIRREGVVKPWPRDAAAPLPPHLLGTRWLGVLDHGCARACDHGDQPGKAFLTHEHRGGYAALRRSPNRRSSLPRGETVPEARVSGRDRRSRLIPRWPIRLQPSFQGSSVPPPSACTRSARSNSSS